MKLFIYGAQGAGIEVYDLARRINKSHSKYSDIILIDDFQEETSYYGTQRIHYSTCHKYMGGESAEFAIAVGEPGARRILSERIAKSGYSFATLIDNTAIISETAQIEQGCIINSGAIVSSNVHLEENCMIMYQAIIGHDAYIKRDTIVCPKSTIGGGSTVGEQCFVGINSSMKQGVNLGDRVIVGMGSMIFRDVEADNTVVGNPARVTKGNSEHKVFI